MATKPRNRKKRLFLATLAALVIAGIVDQVWVWNDRRITVGPHTTFITTPLRDGYPDYLGALNAKLADGLRPEDNAAPDLVKLGGTADDPDAWAEAVYRRWNLPLPADRSPVLQPYYSWYLEHRAATASAATAPDPPDFAAFTSDDDLKDKAGRELMETTQKPWSDREYPNVAAWLASQDKAFAILERAADKTRFYVPMATEDGAFSSGGEFGVVMAHWPKVGWMRDASMMLCSRAMHRLLAGDGEGFEADIIRSARLARLADQLGHPIFHLVGVGIDVSAARCVQAAAVSGKLSAAQAEHLRQALSALGPLSSPKICLCDYQRFETLDVICSSQRKDFGSGFASDTGSRILLAVEPFNFDRCLTEANDYFDRLSASLDQPSYRRREQALDALEKEIEDEADRGVVYRITHLPEAYLEVIIPSLGRLHRLHTAGAQERALALVTLSLRAYQAKMGHFPAQLADLKDPDAVDLFADAPLIYRRQQNGYVLYSVGENLTDDGGKREDNARTGDLSVTAGE